NYTGVNPGIFTAAGFYLHPLDEIIHNSPNYPKAINTYYPHNGDLFDQAIADNGETEGEHFAISHGPSSTDLERSSRTMVPRSEEHTSELQSRENLVCRLLLQNKNIVKNTFY